MVCLEKIEAINTMKELKKYQTETNKIEDKTALGGFPKKCYDTISNFSNKYDGIIIFGEFPQSFYPQLFVAEGAQSMENVLFKTKNSKLFEMPNSSKKIREYVGLSSKSYVTDSIIKSLLKADMLEYTNKNSINARNQKYISRKKIARTN